MKVTIEIEIPAHGKYNTSADARDVEKILEKITAESVRILEAVQGKTTTKKQRGMNRLPEDDEDGCTILTY